MGPVVHKQKLSTLIAKNYKFAAFCLLRIITLLNIEGGGGPGEDGTRIHYTNTPL